jgi:hypothetical protein
LGLRFSAISEGGVTLQGITSSFFAVKPTQQRFRELNFQVECELIHFIEVSDPGRCIMGKLTRRPARRGECLDQVDIPPNPIAKLVKKPA